MHCLLLSFDCKKSPTFSFLKIFYFEQNRVNMAGSSNGSLAGSKRKMEFEHKKEFFETVAPSLTCDFCKMVPKQGPFYISKNGDGRMACSDCKDEKLPNSVAVPCTENILKALPLVACQYRKNDCQVVQDPKNISYHEEDCEFRDVQCYYGYCKENVAFSKLLTHIKNAHGAATPDLTKSIGSFDNENGPNFMTFIVTDATLSEDRFWGGRIFEVNGKKFLIHFNSTKSGNCSFWLQMYGSKFEAKNYQYSIQLEEKEDLGTPIYKGPMKSLDDRKTEVFNSKIGLLVASDVIKKHRDENHILKIFFEMKDLKPKDDEMDRDSNVSNEGE